MIKNYFLTAYRNILRQKGFSFLNIIGLSLSISVCMLIIVITFDQFSYDNFHSKKDRIYRVLSTNTISTESFNELATSPIPLGAEVFRNTSTIEDYIVINNSFSGDISYEGSTLALNGLYVSENFFNLFDFPLIGGAPDKVLVDLYTMVLTEDAAKKNFGKNEAIGKEIMLDSIIYKVTGIIPKTKIKSHIQFEGIASLSSLVAKAKMKGEKDPTLNWKNYWSSYTYFLIKEGVNPESLYPLLDKIGAEHYATDDEHKFKFNFQPLTKITPGPLLSNELGMSMPKPFIIFLAGLALVIIVSAAFNYTSLSVARSLLRAKEVGVRKTLGATKGQIITQFLFEAVMIAILSSFVGFIILQALIPGFSGMKLMSMIQIRPEQNISIYIWFFVFAFVTGLISGVLPSIFISNFQPIKVFKGVSNIKLFSKVTLREILLVTQFAFSMIFIITIIIVYRQMSLMVNSDMGFDKEVVFNIRLQGYEFNKVKDVYSSIPEITKISGSSHVPGVGSSWDIKLKCNKADEENLTLNYFSIDSCYIETMGLKLVAGGNFPKDLSSKGQNIIINEKAVSKLRFSSATDAIGKSVWETHDSILVTVCGVVKDYKYVSLLRKSDALVLRNNPNDYRVATLRINSSNMVQTIDKLKAEWKKIDPIHEFQGQFVEEEIREYYSNFEDIIYTVGFTTILAIIIASLGLLGMATFSAQTRIKEVCIRKVYGADVKHIIYLVSKRYIWLLAISALIAVPLAFLINNLWLEFLAHHVDIGFFTIFLGVFIVLLIGLVTIASQTFKAANSNPADLLRYD